MDSKILSTTAGIIFCAIIAICFMKTFYGDTNECQMTYMYYYPRFVKLNVSLEASFKNYGLYAYAEGSRYDNAMSNTFTGIPILFIPGHSGSYRQIRSLASISMRKVTDIFDYFAIDPNGELSAFNGDLLIKQTNFVALCIKRILSFYKNNHSSVIIVGHSMGGIIARGLFMSPIFNSSEVNLIVTLATPHAPVLLTDWKSYYYYNRLYEYWKIDAARSDWNITLVSIGGGFRDLQVRPGLFYNRFADLNVVTTAIPGVGVSMDHLCILWCKSFIEILARMLYDTIDAETETLIVDKIKLLNILRYHLIQRTNGKQYVQHPQRLILYKNQHVKRMTDVRGSVHGTELHTYVMIKLIDKPQYEYLFISTINLPLQNWIGVCNDNEIVQVHVPCNPIINLSGRGFTGYDKKDFGRRYIDIYIREWIRRNMTHVVVQLPVLEDPVSFNYEMYKKSKRTALQPSIVILLKDTTVIERTERNALFYQVPLPKFPSLRVLEAKLIPFRCSAKKGTSVIRYYVRNHHEDSYVISKTNKEASLKFFKQTPKLLNDGERGTSFLYLYLDPSCTYSLRVGPVYSHSLVLNSLQFGSIFVTYLAIVVLLCLRRQFCSMIETGIFPPMDEGLKLMEPAVLLLHFIRIVLEVWPSEKFYFNLGRSSFNDAIISFNPTTVLSVLKQGSTDLPALLLDDAYTMNIPIVLHALAYAVIHMFQIVLKITIIIICKLLKMLHIQRPVKILTRHTVLVIPNVPIIDVWAIILCFVAWKFGSGNFFVGGIIYYFLKLCTFREDNVKFRKQMDDYFAKTSITSEEEVLRIEWLKIVTNDINVDDRTNRLVTYDGIISNYRYANGAYNFHFTLFVVWSILTVVSLPSAITSYYNYLYSDITEPDSTTKFMATLLITGSSIWSINAVYNKVGWCTNYLTYFIFLVSLKLAITPIQLYYLPLLITLVFIYITIALFGKCTQL